jgi:hypothetical protein
MSMIQVVEMKKVIQVKKWWWRQRVGGGVGWSYSRRG